MILPARFGAGSPPSFDSRQLFGRGKNFFPLLGAPYFYLSTVMIKPLRIFLIFSLSIALLIALIFAFPSGVIPMGDDFELHFFSKEELLHPGGRPMVDIRHIVEGIDTGTAKRVEPLPGTDRTDTAGGRHDSLPHEAPPLRFVVRAIEYPPGGDTCLQRFFEALQRLKTDRSLIRLLHYGDSQIEGDRITSVLRHYFQSDPEIGGCGPGLLPVKDVLQGRLALGIERSDNWIEYSSYLKNGAASPHHDYGLLGNYYRYIPYPDSTLLALYDSLRADSLPLPAADTVSAWWKAEKRKLGYPSARRAEIFRIIYNHNPLPLPVQLVCAGRDTLIDTLPATGRSLIRNFPLDTAFTSLLIRFRAPFSPDIYGFALDGREGMAVDNIGLRGSAVVNFAAMNVHELSRQLRFLNVKMIILQFGVNVVPYVTKKYGFYEQLYYRNLKALRKAMPDLPVLVIGVSDMARKEGTGYASYPNIEKIRDAQRKAAFRAGCAFWDLYEAMGGHNSMLSWVQHDPPLANDDYTHFLPAGSRLVGKMIYDAIMKEYDAYRHERKEP